jgi:hypothetical protein
VNRRVFASFAEQAIFLPIPWTDLGRICDLNSPNTRDPAVDKSSPERRKYPRFILRIGLRLKGTKGDGAAFEETVSTSVVSAGGFACTCLTYLAEGTVVDVFLLANERLLDSAKVLRVEPTSPPWYNYSFAFAKPSDNWFLVRE